MKKLIRYAVPREKLESVRALLTHGVGTVSDPRVHAAKPAWCFCDVTPGEVEKEIIALGGRRVDTQ